MLIELSKSSFKPGELLSGKAIWEEGKPGLIELGWSTTGRGEPESSIVSGTPLPSTGEFTFTLPLTPWSVSGKLLSIKWFVRLTVGELKTQSEFALSPNGEIYPLGV